MLIIIVNDPRKISWARDYSSTKYTLTMKTELLNVVDENDLVIDIQSREYIHAHGLRHRAVHILIFNQQGKLFLQKRSQQKDMNKGLWDTSTAGHVDEGEEYSTCAIRETKEELGIEIKLSLQKLFKLPACRKSCMEFIQVFQGLHDGPFILNPDEIDKGNWFSISDISKRIEENDATLTETFKIIWRQYQLIC